MVRLPVIIMSALMAVSLPGCMETGVSKSAAGVVTADQAPFGPRIVFDPLALPVPEIPFPNDLVLVGSDDSATGRAWNISREAPTANERALRERFANLDGFGTFAPVFFGLDAPIDMATLTAETVMIINIEPGHPREGERVPLEFEDGYYPLTGAGGGFWAHDPSGDLPDFLLPRDNDVTVDGVTWRASGYEVETNTVILRPLVPMAPEARHAVLVTRGLLGEGVDDEGNPVVAPVRSPFVYKAHAAQTRYVARARELAGLSDPELAFGWTFTTRDVTRPLARLREGLYGAGPMARLAEMFPPRFDEIRDSGVTHDANGVDYPADEQDHPYIVQGDFLAAVLGLVISLVPDFAVSFAEVDYVAFGSLRTPDIRTGDERTLGLNTDTGEGQVGVASVPFLITVPKTTARHKPPFPVVIYFHGTGTSRMEALAIADNMARQGIAMLAFDEVGHGPIIPDIRLALSQQGLDPGIAELAISFLADLLVPERLDEFSGLSLEEGLAAFAEVGLFSELAFIGRTEDATGDGALESGESFFFADPFKQCAAIHQNLVDFFQIVRVLRGLSQDDVPPAVADPASAPPQRLLDNVLRGDFNADGVLDVGGPDVWLGVAGTSLGGVHSVIAGAMEPEITTVTPVVAGGGLGDILMRSRLRQITRVIYLEIFGPLLIGCPDGSGGIYLSLNDDSGKCGRELAATSVAHLAEVGAGAVVTVTNLANGQSSTHELGADGQGFSLAVEADRWDQLVVDVMRPGGSSSQVLVQTPYEGIALVRNTPEFRRFLGINQQVLDGCDPVNFAPHLFLEPLPGHLPKSVLFDNALADETVPISTGVTLARAAGVFGSTRAQWEPIMRSLIQRGVLTGAPYDVDDLVGDNPPDAPGIGPLAPVVSGPGVSSIRFADVDGRHEYIAGASPGGSFDYATHSKNRLVLFHASGGAAIVDDLCIAEASCPLLDEGLPAD